MALPPSPSLRTTSSFIFASLCSLCALHIAASTPSTTPGFLQSKLSLSLIINAIHPRAEEESQLWKEWRSGFQSAREEAAGDIVDVQQQLESGIEIGDPIQVEEEGLELHPGHKLLERHHADATESYILGGY